MLRLYNTLTKKIEEVPKQDHLNLYTCGPTVYNYAHIGNLRSYILADLLYRTLKFDGYSPRWVMNITDIDDKTIKGAIAKFGKDATVENLREFTSFYLDEFFKDLGEVNVLKDEITFIRVTDVMPQIQEFIVQLIDKGYAYKAEDGSTYFSIEKYQKDFGDYGELVGQKFLEGKKIGARVKVDEYDKENLSDFALWKAWTEADAQIFWDHPLLDKGRPGWHIECSVINNIAFNGQPTDIHTGGVDLIFPHHTNEIAQSQALLGQGNFVRHWFHTEHLLVDGKKMAKSAGNFYTLKNLLAKGASGLDFRYSLFSVGYRSQQNFTFKGLAAAKKVRERYIANPASKISILPEFMEAISNDFNLPQAVAAAIERQNNLTPYEAMLGISEIAEQVLPTNIKELINKRQQARETKDFTRSDDLRRQIEILGYEVLDTPEGQKVKKKLQI